MESNPKAFSIEDIQRYITCLRFLATRLQDAWNQPLAIESMLNYYRKLIRKTPEDKKPPSPLIQAPTLIVFGQRDPFLNTQVAMDGASYCVHPSSKAVLIPEASYFIQQDIPEKLNMLIADFLSK